MKKLFILLVLFIGIAISNNTYGQSSGNEEITLVETKNGLTLTIISHSNGKEIKKVYSGEEANNKVRELGQQGYIKSREKAEDGSVLIRFIKKTSNNSVD